MSTPKPMKDAQTQIFDVAVQMVSQTKVESTGKPIQKPKESTKASKTSSSVPSQKSPNKIQSDRRPKGSNNEIQKFNRFQFLDKDWKLTQTMQNKLQISKVASSKSIIGEWILISVILWYLYISKCHNG